MIICVAFAAFILIICSEAINNNDDQLLEIENRQLDEEDKFGDFQDVNNGEVIEVDRRASSQCEPCGLLRNPCCFPNLCQRRKGKPSKCLQARG
jgi:hypothetical protein